MNLEENREGEIFRIDPHGGGTINPPTSGPIIAFIPDKIRDSLALLEQVRISILAEGPQFAEPFSDLERAAYALAVTRAYHDAVSRTNSLGPSVADVLDELLQVASQETRLVELLPYLSGGYVKMP